MFPNAPKEIASALAKHDMPALSPVFEAFGGRHPYGHLRICRALMQIGRGAEL